jgi:hypothetical protein
VPLERNGGALPGRCGGMQAVEAEVERDES